MLQTFHSTDGASPGSRQAVKALDRRGLTALLGGILLLLCIAGASVWQAQRNSEILGVTQEMRRQRNDTNDLLLAAQDAETSQRGFLLTNNPIYLEPLERAESLAPDLVRRVSAAAPDDKQIVTLRQVVTAKFAELRQTVELAKAGKLAAAMAIVRTNAGSTNMTVLRKIIAELEATQDGRLLEQVVILRRGSRLLVAIDVAGLVMVLALSGLIGLGIRESLAALRSAQAKAEVAYDALERSNDRLDETVRIRTAALTEANEEVQRFAYIVSHDLRSPLVNIMGFTSELEQAAGVSRHVIATDAPAELREAATEEIPEALRFIRTSTAKMDRLINAILRLSREGRRVLTVETLDMTALLGGLVETMQHQAAVKDAEIEIGPLPPLLADRLAVEQVFGNVVENALKYLKPGRPGLVRITGRLDGAMARFEVSDNGRGIAPKDYERVFELFRRAGDQSVPGEGIGLAHVRALVRRLGGTIECASELGSGTTFTVQLPAKATYNRESAA